MRTCAPEFAAFYICNIATTKRFRQPSKVLMDYATIFNTLPNHHALRKDFSEKVGTDNVDLSFCYTGI